ncbi:MAG: glycosyltransferase [Mycoplasmatales bacterium]|nr:glycosyltransferase [Mycoplasmatales bacterium]
MKTLILIPVYNSQDTLLDILSKLKVIIPEADILAIDHGSTDRTKYLLMNNNINYLTLPLKASYYDALSLGMIFAYKNKYDMVVEWDDKGKFNTHEIKYFMTIMRRKKPDYILGSRFLTKKTPKKWNRIGTRILRNIIRISVHKKISDPTMRFRAYGEKAIKYFGSHDSPSPAIDTISETIRMGYNFVEEQVTLSKKFDTQMHDGPLQSSREIFRWCSWLMIVLPFKKNTNKKIKKHKGVKNE